MMTYVLVTLFLKKLLRLLIHRFALKSKTARFINIQTSFAALVKEITR